MKSKNIDILRNFGAIAEELRDIPTPEKYWINEENELSERIEKNNKFNQSISMSNEKFHKCFSL